MWVRSSALAPLPAPPDDGRDPWEAAVLFQHALGLELITVARITDAGTVRPPCRVIGPAPVPTAVDAVPLDRRQLVAVAPYTACTGHDHDVTMADIIGATDRLLDAINSAPDCDTIVLTDPAAVACRPADEDAIVDALDRTAREVSATVIWYPWGGAVSERLHALVYDSAVDVMAHDMVAAPDQQLYSITEYRGTDPIGFGIADASGAVVLAADGLVDRLQSIRTRIPSQSFTGIYLLPAEPPESLPWDSLEPLFDAIVTAAYSS